MSEDKDNPIMPDGREALVIIKGEPVHYVKADDNKLKEAIQKTMKKYAKAIKLLTDR